MLYLSTFYPIRTTPTCCSQLLYILLKKKFVTKIQNEIIKLELPESSKFANFISLR